MYNLGFSSCCCNTRDILSNFNKDILRVIQRGEDNMKEFKYKNNVYIINDDIVVKEVVTIYKEDGDTVIYVTEPGNYIAKQEYSVSKGYHTIETFETEEEANNFVDKILKEIGE